MITGEYRRVTRYLLNITLAGEGECLQCGRCMLILYSIGMGDTRFTPDDRQVWQLCPVCLVKALADVERKLRAYNKKFGTKLSPIPE